MKCLIGATFTVGNIKINIETDHQDINIRLDLIGRKIIDHFIYHNSERYLDILH